MIRHLWTGTRMLLIMIALVLVYQVVVTGLAQVLLPYQANGSLIRHNGVVVGAGPIGQAFTTKKFFWSRPSAASYNAAASAASNFGPTNPALLKEVKTNLAAFLKANPGVKPSQVPIDMVTSSDSGLDPDITVASAMIQVPRVAAANGLSASSVRALVVSQEVGRWLGLYGLPHVNVLRLNLALVKLAHQQGS
ncbi:MAG: potassium-transporting ATPase subunit KdpC [Thermaerobacter sp.]|nr:potassium-transporting ATPase subunit KdpC [Thermaerobacter sp.]